MLVLFEARLDRCWLSEDDLWNRDRYEHHRELSFSRSRRGRYAVAKYSARAAADTFARNSVIPASMR